MAQHDRSVFKIIKSRCEQHVRCFNRKPQIITLERGEASRFLAEVNASKQFLSPSALRHALTDGEDACIKYVNTAGLQLYGVTIKAAIYVRGDHYVR